MKLTRMLMAGLMLALLSAPLTAAAAPAAQANLIQNGGFETSGGATGASWLPWWFEEPKPGDGSLNYAFKPSWSLEMISNGAAPALIYSGNTSQRVINNWDPWTAGLKQTVTAPAGTRVRLTAYARMWTASNFWPEPSDPSVGGFMKVGLDPDGSDYPTASNADVAWSGAVSPHGGWQSVSVEATVGASGKITVILWGTYRGFSRLWMGNFWDEVSLVSIGTGPAPTAPGGQPGPTSPPQPQPTRPPFVMPTAGADGNIIYIVQPGDTCWYIAAITQQTIEQLLALNGGTLNCSFLSVGQRVVIGQTAPPASPTPAVLPTATPDPNASPTAAALPGGATAVGELPNAGALCALLYNDTNGNGLREEAEGLLAGGQFTVVDMSSGQPVESYITTGQEVDGHCFDNLGEGVYTLSSAPPTGFNSTTAPNAQLQVVAGSRSNVEFGAQPGSGTQPETTDTGTADDRLRTALFGAAGIMLLLSAAGVAGFLMLRRR